MRGAWTRHGLLGVAVAVGLVGALGSLDTGNLPGNGDHWSIAVVAMAYAWLGWVVTGRHGESLIGWLLLVGGVVEAASFTAAWWSAQSLFVDPGSLPGGAFAAWATVWLQAVSPVLVFAAPLVLFPAGRVRSRRWWWFAVVVGGVIGALAAAAAMMAVPVALGSRPVSLLDLPGVTQSGWAGGAVGAASMARLLGLVAAMVSLIGVFEARRRASSSDRAAYTTVGVGAGVLVGTFAAGAVVGPLTGQRHETSEVLYSFAALAVPAAIAVAIARFRAYEVRAAVSRSVLVVGVGSALAAVYLGVLGLVSVVIDVSSLLTLPSALAAGVVVLASSPVVNVGRRLTRRWFGRAAGATVIADRFGAQATTDTEATEALRFLAQTLREELRLGAVEVTIDGMPSARVGDHDAPVTRVPLQYAQRLVGEVAVSARPGESLAGPDLRLLADLAGHVAVAGEAIRVSDDLRHAQHALQTAHAEERRRVRRDLHDGVAPTLASARLKLTALRRARDDHALDEVVDQVTNTIREIRRIVDGLQPSVLEDLGLVPALQLLVVDTRQIAGISVTLDAPASLPDLSADAANTAYRAVSEALANVVRHSQASTCTVRLEHHDGMLEVDVTDNGTGFEPSTASGMGLRSIATRASLANGDATIASTPGAGTTISVRVPA